MTIITYLHLQQRDEATEQIFSHGGIGHEIQDTLFRPKFININPSTPRNSIYAMLKIKREKKKKGGKGPVRCDTSQYI
jgi:hypothetical protein